MSQQFCSNCGSSIEEDAKFCTACGHSVAPGPGSTPTKSANKKWIYIGIAAVVAVLAFFIFNQKDSPEKVAEDFVSHVLSFDVEQANKLLARDADAYLQEEMDWMIQEIKNDPSVVDEQKEYAEEFGYDIEDIEVTEVDEREAYAFVYITVSYSNGETEEIAVDLLQENKQWKVEDSY